MHSARVDSINASAIEPGSLG